MFERMFERRVRGAPVSKALIFAALLALCGGCAKIPAGRAAIDDVTIRGATQVDEDEIEQKITTAPSPKLIGLFRGVVYDYEIFDRFALQRDLARIERLYRARGFYAAHARAGRFMTTSEKHVRVEIIVEEGPPILNDQLTFTGLEGLPPDLVAAVQKAARAKLPQGKPFDEDQFKAAEIDARRALTDRGYAYAKVTRDVNLDVVHLVANASMAVVPDKPATFGKITIQGVDPDGPGPRPQEIPEGPMRRAIDIKEGDPYSTAALDSATQALLDLEVFSAVEIVPALPEPPPEPRVVPLVVKVEPSKLRQIRLGGGLEFDQIKTDLHLLIGWEDHNFFGGLRDFSVDFKPGAVLYPTRINNIVAPDAILPEARLRLQLKQPGFVEARTNLFIRPEVNVYPLLVKTNPGNDDPVVGYYEFKGATGVDRTFGKLFASLGYNAQVEQPFAYKGALDPDLKLLVITYPELIAHLDFRDDRIHPHKGVYLENGLQVAGGPGLATDVKIEPEVRTYIPIAKKITFATRATVGFLFPANYGDFIRNHLNDTPPTVTRAERVKDIETVFFRGFFSGGASSNRGFPIRGIAPHGVVPFLNPATAAQQVRSRCDPTAADFNPSDPGCLISIGGFTLWELSNELRFNVVGPFSAATFCDMSDVSPHPGNVRLDHMHLSCGLGARYETPVGPIRLDVGYRVQPFQVLGSANEAEVYSKDHSEGIQPTLFGVPVAIAFGIGEAF